MPATRDNTHREQEIERKFLVSREPEGLARHPHHRIRQGYLAIASDGSEVRIRQLDDRHFLTCKGPGTLSRRELETEVSKDQFETLWPATEGCRVEKIRYKIGHGDGLIELDVFQACHEGLLLAEIEFDSEAASARFRPPDWFGEEVTNDKRYKNQQLARHGIPRKE